MKIRITRNVGETETWFAWHPVIAEKTCSIKGVLFYIAFLENVERTLTRVQGITQYKYVLK